MTNAITNNAIAMSNNARFITTYHLSRDLGSGFHVLGDWSVTLRRGSDAWGGGSKLGHGAWTKLRFSPTTRSWWWWWWWRCLCMCVCDSAYLLTRLLEIVNLDKQACKFVIMHVACQRPTGKLWSQTKTRLITPAERHCPWVPCSCLDANLTKV